MSAAAPMCTFVKTDGLTCGSPAVKGSDRCFHHAEGKTAAGNATEQVADQSFTPIPFVFPQDRVAMQFNYFLLLQALNEQRVERRTVELMLLMLKAMDKNIDKVGALVSAASEDMSSAGAVGERVGEKAVGEKAVSDGTVGGKAGRERAVSERPVSKKPMNAETEEALKIISEVNASEPRYADLDYSDPLHLTGQRMGNLGYQRSMSR